MNIVKLVCFPLAIAGLTSLTVTWFLYGWKAMDKPSRLPPSPCSGSSLLLLALPGACCARCCAAHHMRPSLPEGIYNVVDKTHTDEGSPCFHFTPELRPWKTKVQILKDCSLPNLGSNLEVSCLGTKRQRAAFSSALLHQLFLHHFPFV